jgi:hypothetical protein
MAQLERCDRILDTILLHIENDGESSSDSNITDEDLTPVIFQIRNTGRVPALVEFNHLLQIAAYLMFQSESDELELVITSLESLQLKINNRLTQLGDYIEI